jgi:hypothetical protein
LSQDRAIVRGTPKHRHFNTWQHQDSLSAS